MFVLNNWHPSLKDNNFGISYERNIGTIRPGMFRPRT